VTSRDRLFGSRMFRCDFNAHIRSLLCASRANSSRTCSANFSAISDALVHCITRPSGRTKLAGLFIPLLNPVDSEYLYITQSVRSDAPLDIVVAVPATDPVTINNT
jgi:hypothetical protein